MKNMFILEKKYGFLQKKRIDISNIGKVIFVPISMRVRKIYLLNSQDNNKMQYFIHLLQKNTNVIV